MSFQERVVAAWYEPRPTFAAWLAWPLSLLFGAVGDLRRALHARGILPVERLPVPVIVVGNITAGGSGKTPLVIALAEALRARGFHLRRCWLAGLIEGFPHRLDVISARHFAFGEVDVRQALLNKQAA